MAGDSLLRLEEPEKAVPYLREALAADPKLLPRMPRWDSRSRASARTLRRFRILEKALDLDDDGSLHYQLARAYQADSGIRLRRANRDGAYKAIIEKNEEQKEEVAQEAQIEPPR